MSKATIYHNPRCSKSRQALTILEEKKVELRVIEYLKNPPTRAELAEIIALLRIAPQDLLRKNEAEYKELNLEKASDETIINAMTKHPILIERPIVIANNKAVIGRPPEKVLEIV